MASAREHPRYANFDFSNSPPMNGEWHEFPMMYYPGATDQKKPYGADGKPLKGIVVRSEEELAAVRGLEPAPKPAVVPTANPTLEPTSSPGVQRVQTPEDERAALILEADTAGVQIDRRWSLARIQDALDAHRAEQQPL